MKTRKEYIELIEKEMSTTENRTSQTNIILIPILEVLLDIRDLLIK